MDELKIQYCFKLDEQTRETIDLCFNAFTMEIVDTRIDFPEWTRLEFHQCTHCPLDSVTHQNCPTAVNLARVIERFDNVVSHDEIDLEVITSERRVLQHTTAQRGISALLGLLIATSGCPYTNFLKPMARFHLPLASEEETIFRAAGMFLLAQFFLRKARKESDLDFSGLTKIYADLHTLNTKIAERLRYATQTDSSVNAIILLDMFTNMMPYVIEDHLDEIRHLFDSYL